MLTPFCKCPGCHQMLYIRDVEDSLSVCPECGYHFRLDAKMRIAITVDEGSFEEAKQCYDEVREVIANG